MFCLFSLLEFIYLQQVCTSSLCSVAGDLWIQYDARSRFHATHQVLLFYNTITIFFLIQMEWTHGS